MELKNWKLAYCDNVSLISSPKTEKEILSSGYEIIPATVPGNVELDLSKAGKLPEDIYFGTNILETQKWEFTHYWYFTELELKKTDKDRFLRFEGIDTAAEIFIDGVLLAETENMLIPYEFCINHIAEGRHSLVVHITPAALYSQKYPVGQVNTAMKYNLDSVVIRKAPYMYGWDIMPRTVSAGLWRPVYVVEKNKERVEKCYISLLRIDSKANTGCARISLNLKINDCFYKYAVEICGKCGDSVFQMSMPIYSSNIRTAVNIENLKLWWPKNYGEPNLYDVMISLKKNGEVIDEYTTSAGMRIIELERTSLAGKDGKFCFIVNNQRIFVMGSNWVPTDAFPSRHDEFTLRGIEMVNDLGCNMIRCWGGNVYPSHLLYDYCDRHGIMVWQDFSMACGIYPRDERFQRILRNEAVTIVEELRRHPSIALWAGDNECDCSMMWSGLSIDGRRIKTIVPSDNVLTRCVLAETVRDYDTFRPYLPSSPYIDEVAEKDMFNARIPEDHLWGPRDYFKGSYYGTSINNFSSETGYHGCPEPDSLRKYIGEEHINNHGDNKICSDEQWLVHCASPETGYEGASFAYRIPLMTRQIERLFGKADEDINVFALQSQISQAEAMKYFIERFRIGKPFRTGIIWWNIIDGWPQISDAIVDWYGAKKLAYYYILRSQQQFCIMCDEPDENGMLTLVATNDGTAPQEVSYTVSDAVSGMELLSGKCGLQPNEIRRLEKLPQTAAKYLVIRWNGTTGGLNHFVSNIGEDVTFDDYYAFMKKVGFDKESFFGK